MSKPKAKPVRISEEDFDAWRHNAITEAVFAHLGGMRARLEQAWLDQLRTTDGKEIVPADPVYLAYLKIELRSKIEFIEDIEALSLEDIQEDHGSQPSQIGAIARQAAAGH